MTEKQILWTAAWIVAVEVPIVSACLWLAFWGG